MLRAKIMVLKRNDKHPCNNAKCLIFRLVIEISET